MDSRHYRRSALTLSQKQYAKITGTIASVRKRREIDTGVLYNSDERGAADNNNNDNDNHDRGNGENGDGDDSDNNANDNSFVAEESFIRAPLNPRIPDNVKPQRNMYFSKSKRDKHVEEVPSPDGCLNTLSTEIQEALILEELLNALMGIPGVHITCDLPLSDEVGSPRDVKFTVSRLLEPSLRDLAERILPLATSYTTIKAFIQQRSNLENGLVNHALCASMRTMLRDYHALIIQLENAFHSDPHFSLQKLWFFVHPTLHTLSLLQILTRALTRQTSISNSDSDENSDEDSDSSSTRARNAELGLASNLNKIVNMPLDSDLSLNSSSRTPPKGGEVLTILNTLLNTHAGDPRACLVFGTLLKDASRPYARILLNWVKRGHLEDPYEESMVRESRTIDKGILERDYVDEYWERRYTLRDGSTSPATSDSGINILNTAATVAKKPAVLRDGACIPLLLEPWKHKILLAGKYLNVIRECGMSVDHADAVSSPSPSETRDQSDIAMDDENFFQIISNSYTHANKTLLHLLLHTHQLLPRLRTLHHFFFLSRSFYLTHFFDIAASELRKPAKGVNTAKLNTLLSVAVNADDVGGASSTPNSGLSSLSSEVGRDDIKLIMQGTSLVEWLIKISSVKGAPLVGESEEWLDKEKDRGTEKEKTDKDKSRSNLTVIDFLSLDYTPPFPLSLVISRKAILRYQLIFRFLLSLKYLEYQLSNMWVEQKGTVWRATLPPSLSSQPSVGTITTAGRLTPLPINGRTPTPTTGRTDARSPTPAAPSPSTMLFKSALHSSSQSLTQWRTALLNLRGQMLAVVRHLLAFVLYSVLEVHWRMLEKKLSAAEKGSRGGDEEKDKAPTAESDEHANAGLNRDHIETVDQLLRDHVDFLDTCLKECMLSSSRLVKQHHRLLQTCTAFTWYTGTFTKSLTQGVAALETLQTQMAQTLESAVDSPRLDIPSSSSSVKTDEMDKAMKTRWEFLERFKTNFEHWLQSYIEFVSLQASSENAALMPLVGRLKSVVGSPVAPDFVIGARNEGKERVRV